VTELERMLRAAGAEAGWPRTPDVASAVVDRIGGVTPVQRGDSHRWHAVGIRRPLAVALAVLLLAAATAAAVPAIRDPVLDWLGLRSVRIERVPQPLPEGPGSALALGEHTTLANARARLAFSPLLASGLGPPTVYYDRIVPGGQLGLVYRGGRLFITEVVGELQSPILEKFLGAATKVERLRIAGERALWIGGLHQYAYLDRAGQIRPETVRTAGSVLLWRHGRLLLRLEGARSKAEALGVATSLRAAP
jgi:hypothetical protein